jgi:alkylation response protein AidB-like acyl-CoA dehydrogenase
VSPPSLAGTPRAAATQTRFAELAREARDKCHAHGRTLDDVAGAADAFAFIADAALDLPLPGKGATQARWSALAAVAEVDVTLGRLFEAHADAIAIFAELQGPAADAGQRWAVWAAEGPASTLRARPDGDGWRLSGQKPWCSGAIGATHALVTAESPQGRALFAARVDAGTLSADPATYQGIGLTGTATYTTTFAEAAAGDG